MFSMKWLFLPQTYQDHSLDSHIHIPKHVFVWLKIQHLQDDSYIHNDCLHSLFMSTSQLPISPPTTQHQIEPPCQPPMELRSVCSHLPQGSTTLKNETAQPVKEATLLETPDLCS